MTKKVLSLLLVLCVLFSASAALAKTKTIDGAADRKIKINRAGLNASADEVIDGGKGYSPTTGRKLTDITDWEDNFSGVAVNGVYQPVMVQISNSGNGVGVNKKGNTYVTAPVNGTYADVVYECVQKKGGGETRMTMVFSDTIPEYVGFVRSTRLTHPRLRQEWECAFCTSGYSQADVPAEWKKLGVLNPASPDRTEKSPGIAYVGDYPKVWSKYVWRLHPIAGANSEIFMIADIQRYIVPKDHVPANHTWLFSDTLPEGGDSGKIVYVTYGNKYETDSRLEYDEKSNAYLRYVDVDSKQKNLVYKDTKLVNAEIKKVKSDNKTVKKIVGDRVAGRTFKFANVIIQSIRMNWITGLRPDPELVGTGNADFFMGGKHYEGVWERTDMNSRTVFYDKNGNEIELQRGSTLIILMPYSEASGGRNWKKAEYTVKYE